MRKNLYPCPDGCVVVARAARRDRSDFTPARYTSDGQLVLNSAPAAEVSLLRRRRELETLSLAVQRDGKIIAIGHATPNNRAAIIAAYRFHSDGRPDIPGGTTNSQGPSQGPR